MPKFAYSSRQRLSKIIRRRLSYNKLSFDEFYGKDKQLLLCRNMHDEKNEDELLMIRTNFHALFGFISTGAHLFFKEMKSSLPSRWLYTFL